MIRRVWSWTDAAFGAFIGFIAGGAVVGTLVFIAMS